MALVLSLGVLVVLTISGTTAVDYAVSNARSAVVSKARVSAYTLAEAGLNNALAVVNNPSIDALQQSTLPSSEATASSAPVSEGTAKWWGTLTGHTWKLYGLGLVPSTTGATTNRRLVSQYVDVGTTLTQNLNTHIWDYIMSTGTGSTCDQTIADGSNTGNPATVNARLYVFGNLCIGTSQGGIGRIIGGPIMVKGKVMINEGSSYIGQSASPVSELHVGLGCKYMSNALHTPCQTGTGASGKDNAWSTLAPDTTIPTITAPVADWDYWYANALGQNHPCTTQTGGGLPTWDTNTTRDNSVSTVWNMTPATSYSCVSQNASGDVIGSITWDATNKLFTIGGTMFLDGSAKIANNALNQYNGQGTLYLSGTMLMSPGAKLCALSSGSNCDFTTWNPNTELFAIVANGTGGQDPAGVSIHIKDAQFEGALYGTGTIRPEGTSKVSGPMVASEVELGYNVSTGGQSIYFPLLTVAPVGLPGVPNAHATPLTPYGFSS